MFRRAENVQSAARKEATPRENAIYPACAALSDSVRREIIFSVEKFSLGRNFFLSFWNGFCEKIISLEEKIHCLQRKSFLPIQLAPLAYCRVPEGAPFAQ